MDTLSLGHLLAQIEHRLTVMERDWRTLKRYWRKFLLYGRRSLLVAAIYYANLFLSQDSAEIGKQIKLVFGPMVRLLGLIN
jgi:hypothetical protein